MIDIQILTIILVTHFLADFGLQTQEQATLKSTSNEQLSYHVGTYSLTWLFMSFGILGDIEKAFIFAGITYVAHWITDYHTSRIVKKYFAKDDYHNAFVVIGADQILHYTQLFLTYLMLS